MLRHLALCLPILLLGPVAAAGPGPADAVEACSSDGWHLAGFHYLVRGVDLDRLQGHVRPGENFTIVVSLARCDGVQMTFSTDVAVPPCGSPIRPQAYAVLGALDAANITGPARTALVDDLRAAMECPSFHAPPSVVALFGLVAAAAGGGGIVVYKRRRL